MPIKLETRYVTVKTNENNSTLETNQLWIRIFPDKIFLNSFDPHLTKEETSDVIEYKATINNNISSILERKNIWKQLVDKYGVPRASWLIRAIDGVKDYLAVLNKEENIAAHKMAVNFPELRTNITHLKIEYYQILNKYIAQYLEVLKEAKKFKNDNPELDGLIGRIEEYLEKTKEEMENTIA